MTSPQSVKEYYTKEEYLAFEEASEGKHEYYAGRIVAMAGGTLDHSTISTNVTSALQSILMSENKPCRPFNSDAKIYVEKSESYVYPDTSVVCGEVETHDVKNDGITNPILIVEVLSDSTASYDRGVKFRKYCSLPSFKEYVLITQDEPIVEVLFRDVDFWRMTTTVGLDRSVRLNSLNIEIPMGLIYRDIKNLPVPQFGLDF